MTDYVELHARSAFSFLRGAATPEELIAAGAELKMPAMALLDNDGVYGAARFHLAAKKIGIIKAHIGAEIAVSSFEFRVSISKTRNRIQIPDSKSRVQSPKSRFQVQSPESKFQSRSLHFQSSSAIAPDTKIFAA
jgi:hypothetical protein